MSVDVSLMCSFYILKPCDKKTMVQSNAGNRPKTRPKKSVFIIFNNMKFF